MIGWIGFFGNLTEFLAKKLLDRQFNLALDERRIACRALVSFHNTLVELENATDQFLAKLEPIANGEKTILFPFWIRQIIDQMDEAIVKFKKIFPDIIPAMNILNPELAGLLTGIAVGKKGGLRKTTTSAFKAMEFTVHWKGDNDYETIDITIPTADLVDTNWERQLHIVTTRDKAKYITRNSEWPNDLLEHLVVNNSRKLVIRATDVDKIIELYRILSDHLRLLKKARSLLAEFIKNNFKIEDILGANTA